MLMLAVRARRSPATGCRRVSSPSGAPSAHRDQLTIGNTAEVADAVESGAAELGFVEGAVESESLESLVVARDQLVLVVGPEHPWGDARSLKPADLLKGEWVLREIGSGTRSAFKQG